MNIFLQESHKSIRLKPNGFSLLKKDRPEKIEYKDFNTPLSKDVLREIKVFLGESDDPVTVISNITTPILIPKVLFDETAKEDYIHLHYDVQEPITVFQEELSDYYLLYFLSETLKAILEQIGSTLSWRHLTGLLYSQLQQFEHYSPKSGWFSLFIEEHSVDFIFEKEGKLQIINRFEYSSEFDILYQILNICKQFQLHPSIVSILLSCSENEKIELLLKQYVGNIFTIKNL